MPEFDVLYYPDYEPSKRWMLSHLLFFDTIHSIIPLDVKPIFSRSTLELMDENKNFFQPIDPIDRDINIDYFTLESLEKEFRMLSKTKDANSKKEPIGCSFDGLSIPGKAFLHSNKTSPSVLSLLEKFQLIEENSQEICDSVGVNNYHVVDKRASDLIVSLVADKIASRNGYRTITDQDPDFAINSVSNLNSNHVLKYRSLSDTKNLLLYSLTSRVIPQNIEQLSIEDYVQIRDKYEAIREPFHEVISYLNDLNGLENIDDDHIVKMKVDKITQEFNSEVEKLKKSTTMSKIKKWISIGIAGITLISACTGSMGWAIAGATGQCVVEAVKLKPYVLPEPKRTSVQRMIGNLQKDIINKSQIEALLKN